MYIICIAGHVMTLNQCTTHNEQVCIVYDLADDCDRLICILSVYVHVLVWKSSGEAPIPLNKWTLDDLHVLCTDYGTLIIHVFSVWWFAVSNLFISLSIISFSSCTLDSRKQTVARCNIIFEIENVCVFCNYWKIEAIFKL